MSSNGVSSSNVPAALADGHILSGRIARHYVKNYRKYPTSNMSENARSFSKLASHMKLRTWDVSGIR